MFVSDFYNLARVQEAFGQLAKVKEECRVISTEKGETFTIPFYITKPSLLTLSSDSGDLSQTITWKGRLPSNLPSSFIGLFCSFQHFVQVKIIWKSEETGRISVVQEEIVFKVIGLPSDSIVLGVLDDIQSNNLDLDDLFPDNLIISDSNHFKKILEQVSQFKHQLKHPQQDHVTEEFLRSIVESDSGYNRSLSVETDEKNILTIASIHLKRSKIHPGTQIFLTINLQEQRSIDLIKLKLDCVEEYRSEYLQEPFVNELCWRDTVKEIKISPGCQDRLDLIIPIPPDLPPSNSCQFFDFKWELSLSFLFDQKDFDLKIPLQFYSLNYKFNKKRH